MRIINQGPHTKASPSETIDRTTHVVKTIAVRCFVICANAGPDKLALSVHLGEVGRNCKK